jgi:hypothetical protein
LGSGLSRFESNVRRRLGLRRLGAHIVFNDAADCSAAPGSSAVQLQRSEPARRRRFDAAKQYEAHALQPLESLEGRFGLRPQSGARRALIHISYRLGTMCYAPRGEHASIVGIKLLDYRLYHFSRGHIHRFTDIRAPDDVQAVRKARTLIENAEPAELWRGAQKVKAFNRDQHQ